MSDVWGRSEVLEGQCMLGGHKSSIVVGQYLHGPKPGLCSKGKTIANVSPKHMYFRLPLANVRLSWTRPRHINKWRQVKTSVIGTGHRKKYLCEHTVNISLRVDPWSILPHHKWQIIAGLIVRIVWSVYEAECVHGRQQGTSSLDWHTLRTLSHTSGHFHIWNQLLVLFWW